MWQIKKPWTLWHCWGGMEAQVSLTVSFSSSAFFGLLFLIFLLTITHSSSMGFRAGEFAVKHTNTMVIKPTFGVFGSVGRCQILLKNEISSFKKLFSRRKHEVLQSFLVNGCSDCFQKTQWTNTSGWHCTQIITDCGNLTSQVTYVTMVPRVGNETLRPLGVATGNASAWLVSEDTYVKTPPVGRRQPMTSLPACHNISAAGSIHHQLLRLKLASEAWPKA